MDFNHFNVDLLKMAKEASDHKKTDSEVINATLGVFLNDYMNLYSFKSVEKALKNIDQEQLRSYLALDGGEAYKNNILKYLFATIDSPILKSFYHYETWTSGGSGAIYLALNFYRGKTVLLPNIRWPEYDQMVLSLNKEIKEYNLIVDNQFNLTGLKKIFDQTTEKEIFIVINDPAHNPTGYSLTVSEHREFIELVNSFETKLKINVLYDLAYLDFGELNFQQEVMPLLQLYSFNTNIYLAFSGSKSFGVYGLRMGALIFLSRNLSTVEEFKHLTAKKAGAIYGAPNSLSVLLLNSISNSLPELIVERQRAKRILAKRSGLLVSLLKKQGISYYPYKSGFFLTIKTTNPEKLKSSLKADKIYVVPTYQGIRIALSAINEAEIKRFVNVLSQYKIYL